MRAAIVALSLSVCVVVAGCGKGSEKTVVIPGKDGNVTVTSSNDSQHMVMHSADGTATVDINSNGGANTKMPDFAPLYPGAKVTSSVVGANSKDGQQGAMVIFSVAASPTDVVAFYKQKATAAGLPQTMSADINNTQMFAAGKDKKSVTVSASASNGTTQVQVLWGSD
jgi:hypothetical protein